MKILKRLLYALLILLPLAAVVGRFYILPRTARQMNATLNPGPYRASDTAQALHRTLTVADLHADATLWSRDLNQRAAYGHVDVPRLLAGNVAIQAFTLVTKVAAEASIESNTGNEDSIRTLAIASWWPVSSWTNLTERALHQARQLQAAAAASNGKLTLIKSREDMRQYLNLRSKEPNMTAGFLGVEGAQALSGKLENLDRLYNAGIRMIGLAHFHDNEFAGSAHGATKYGLTEAGRTLVQRMQERKVIIDLAHCSAQVIDDVLALATRPVVVSHTGVKGTCDNNRNLSDDQLRRIAQTGGVIGIGFWDTATCGKDARAIAKAIRHAVTVAGIEHVGLGSDYDGGITAPFDASGMALLTEALLQEQFSEQEIRWLMGENVVRLLNVALP
jgi:microsomal dipeptidase-like Zn-dependent dipeptidase